MTRAAPAATVLLALGDGSAGEQLTARLIAEGYAVELARSAPHARVLAAGVGAGVIVLGPLPESGATIALLQEIRRGRPPWQQRAPVLVIGAGSSEAELLHAFEAGADDYVSWPCRYGELHARLRALVRPVHGAEERDGPDRVVVGALELDPRSRTVSFRTQPLELRRLEFDLLAELAGDPRRVFTRVELLRSVWGYRWTGATRTVDTHASRLRRELRRAGAAWVVGVRGVGYRLLPLLGAPAVHAPLARLQKDGMLVAGAWVAGRAGALGMRRAGLHWSWALAFALLLWFARGALPGQTWLLLLVALTTARTAARWQRADRRAGIERAAPSALSHAWRAYARHRARAPAVAGTLTLGADCHGRAVDAPFGPRLPPAHTLVLGATGSGKRPTRRRS